MQSPLNLIQKKNEVPSRKERWCSKFIRVPNGNPQQRCDYLNLKKADYFKIENTESTMNALKNKNVN
jgi:hypothetical protein